MAYDTIRFGEAYEANKAKRNRVDEGANSLVAALKNRQELAAAAKKDEFEQRKQAFFEKLHNAGLIAGKSAATAAPGLGFEEGRDYSPNAVEALAGLRPESMTEYQRQDLEIKKRALGLKEKESAAKTGPQNAPKSRVSDVLKTLKGYYNELSEAGAAVDTGNSGLQNLKARTAASGPGQLAGEFFGTENQSIRNKIKQIQPLLINEIRQAAKMGAKGLDSEKELSFYLQAATDPKRDIASNLAAIQVLDRAYGLGLGTEDMQAPAAGAPEVSEPNPASELEDIDKQIQELEIRIQQRNKQRAQVSVGAVRG